ncbi:MAG TPA: hypothetical protein VND96_17565 [Candidatus Micrarchaeaceae archaeon]|nr:hypothetical protein [Candidatus Micrarchaeaceae archaeon]
MGLAVAVIALLLAFVFTLVAPRLRGVPVGGEVIVRCRQGHLFTTLWVPLASIKAVRLGWARVQRCPVGNHWSLVVPVNKASLKPEEIDFAQAHHDAQVP